MKYRLFDFAGGDGEMLARGGMERVTDHAGAIEQVLAELKKGGWIASEADLASEKTRGILDGPADIAYPVDEIEITRAGETLRLVQAAQEQDSKERELPAL